MNKILSLVLLAVMCCCVVSCNEKPKKEQVYTYKFVKVTKGGDEAKEFEAKNDTDALNQYFKMMEKVIIANLDKEDSGIEAMYVISPDGDTLNTDNELLQAVMKEVPAMQDIAVPTTKAIPLKPTDATTDEKP